MNDRRDFESDIEACSEYTRPSRREFLLGATVATAGSGTGWPAPVPAGQPLPTVSLGKVQVSRLILGSNPVFGYSHFNRQYDQHMREWFTDERVVQLLVDCERAGINPWQASFNYGLDRQFPTFLLRGTC